jgi:hypothetical protein
MDFVTEITTFPMVLFTVMFGVMLGLWALTFVGFIDFDGADGAADGVLDGAADGALDGLDGLHGAHGALDALDGVHGADGALDALDGLHGAHGALHGADGALAAVDGADGALHGADGLDGLHGADAAGAADAAHGAHGAHAAGAAHAAGGAGDSAMGWLQALGLRKVPVTIAFSFVTIFSSILVFLGQRWLVPADGLMHWLAGTGVAAGGLIGGTLLASLAIRPLAKAVTSPPAARRRDLLGQECTIATGEVDMSFGQATLRNDGAELLIQVRCDPDRLARGAKALVVDWDPQAQAYLVEPMEPLLLGEASDKGD